MRYFAVLALNVFWLVSGVVYAQSKYIDLVQHDLVDRNQVMLGFSFPKNTKYRVFLLEYPQRLVIDFFETPLRRAIPQPSADHDVFSRVRAIKRNNRNLRVIFDLKDTVAVENFSTHIKSANNKILIVSLRVKHTDIKSDSVSLVDDKLKEQSIIQHQKTIIKETDSRLEIMSDWDISGYIGFENLAFLHDGLASQQHNNYISGVFEAEFYKEWDDGRQNFAFVPFYRYSQHDSRRTHFDIRELTWMMVEDSWEMRVGFRKVFWGVAEGLHLIDIINQTDLVENTDTEDKLGQPMINLALINDWGTVDLFLLTGFRERTFSGVEGRFRTIPEVAVGDAVFDKHGLEKHLAYAIRWSHYFGDWDIGISHFYGMGREPRFIPSVDSNGKLKLLPFYETINQTSLDLQMTHESWLWKLEAMVRSGMDKTFFAATGGVEYTFFDLYETGLDLGVVVEYMYDTRGSKNFFAPFQDDFLTALRFGFNDEQSTEILAGVLFDRTSNSKFYNIEASRRIGDSWKIEAEMRLFSGAPKDDSSFIFRDDDHFRVELSYHF